jgi:hypothetical protein
MLSTFKLHGSGMTMKGSNGNLGLKASETKARDEPLGMGFNEARDEEEARGYEEAIMDGTKDGGRPR